MQCAYFSSSFLRSVLLLCLQCFFRSIKFDGGFTDAFGIRSILRVHVLRRRRSRPRHRSHRLVKVDESFTDWIKAIGSNEQT